METKTLREVRVDYTRRLSDIYTRDEAASMFFYVAEELFGLKKVGLIDIMDKCLDEDMEKKFDSVLLRLERHEPVQYIFNKAYFAGLSFYVDPLVLIPRPETEELYRWAEEEVKLIMTRGVGVKEEDLRIIDLCTGSGVLAIALSHVFPKAEVLGCDIRSDILRVAEKNNEICGTGVCFFQYNVLGGKPFDFCQRYSTKPKRRSSNRVKDSCHLIISNPPYIEPFEKKQMRPNVLKYEPRRALFVPENDAMVFTRKIADLAWYYLRPNGILMLEINERLAEENVRILRDYGYEDVEVKNDMQGKNRMIKCRKSYWKRRF